MSPPISPRLPSPGLLLLVLLLHLLALPPAAGIITASVQVPSMGVEVHGHTDDNGTTQFLGIPYAHSPVGRWEEAQPSWQEHVPTLCAPPALLASFDASPAPPVCPQVINGLIVGAEDCLFVNVYRPPSTTSENLKPVMVFIHGGSFILGGISSPLLDGNALATEQDIVVVTLSYRLGVLGFLADSLLPGQGNLAMLDQQLAIKWVHSNIHFFGGDPSAVTLAGESAGAYSACLHMIVPESSKLLKAVLMESGGCMGLPLEEGIARARAFAETVGCKGSNSNSNSSSGGDDDDSSGSMIDCLRQVPLDVLVPSSTAFGQDTYHYWAPLIDGDRFLPSSPAELLNSFSSSVPPSVPPLPILLGFNRDEGTRFLPTTGLQGSNGTDLAYSSWVLNGRMEQQQGLPPLSPLQREELLSLYPPKGDGLNDENVVNIISDAHYKCPSYFCGEKKGAQRHQHKGQEDADPAASSIYFYRFQYVQPEACNLHADDLGCYHGSELPYVWAKPNFTPCGGRWEDEGGREEEEEMGRAMRGYWGAFVRSMGRSPNEDVGEGRKGGEEGKEVGMMTTGRRRMRGQAIGREGEQGRRLMRADFRFGGGIGWPFFEEEEGGNEGWVLLQLDAGNITVVPRDRKKECEFWDSTNVYSKQ